MRALHRALGIKYRLDRAIRYVHRCGFARALRTYRRIRAMGERPVEILLPGLPHPLILRPGTADASTFEKVFIWGDYDLSYPGDVRTVVDAGANCGLSAVYFANRFPAARIIAIEPHDENFALLQRNTRAYRNVTAMRAALWSEDATLGLVNPTAGVDSYRYSPGTGKDLTQAWSVPTLMAHLGLTGIDVVKLDVEGAEAHLLAGRPDWLRRVRMLIVELHDEAAQLSYANAMAGLDVVRYRHGENEIAVARERQP